MFAATKRAPDLPRGIGARSNQQTHRPPAHRDDRVRGHAEFRPTEDHGGIEPESLRGGRWQLPISEMGSEPKDRSAGGAHTLDALQARRFDDDALRRAGPVFPQPVEPGEFGADTAEV